MLWAMFWNYLRRSSPDNWSANCLAKVSKLVEEGRLLEKVSDFFLQQLCIQRGIIMYVL